jgi:flavin reductase
MDRTSRADAHSLPVTPKKEHAMSAATLLPHDYRAAMARLGAAVCIVTTDGPAGRHGMTVSAICSVTDAPPTLLVCINRQSDANAKLKANGVLCVNVLGAQHDAVARRFATHSTPVDERFGVDDCWTVALSGSAKLIGCAASFDCRIVQVAEVGSHSVLFCEVDQVSTEDSSCLIYHDRAFHAVGSSSPLPPLTSGSSAPTRSSEGPDR